jgi:mRNA interferase MazF
MERGEIWWVQVDEKRPVVLLSGGAGPEFRAMQIVPPATVAERRGFVIIAGDQAIEADERRRIIDSASPGVAAIGIEVFFGEREGLLGEGVVRVTIPKDGRTFCTWMLTLSEEYLIERIGVLSPGKLRELDNAMELAAIE